MFIEEGFFFGKSRGLFACVLCLCLRIMPRLYTAVACDFDSEREYL
jgi:hypothetical protein